MLSIEARKKIAEVRGLSWYYCGLSVKGLFTGAVKVFKGDRGTVAVIFNLNEAYVIVTNPRANMTLTAAAIKKNIIQSTHYNVFDIDRYEIIDVLAEYDKETDKVVIAESSVWEQYGIDRESVKKEVHFYLNTLIDLNRFADNELLKELENTREKVCS